MREQGLSSKLLLRSSWKITERQVAVLELGGALGPCERGQGAGVGTAVGGGGARGNFKQLSDRVNETNALVGLVDDQIVNTRRLLWWSFLVRNCLPLMRWRPDVVIGACSMTASCFRWGTDYNSLRIGLTKLMECLMEMMVVDKESGAWHPETPLGCLVVEGLLAPFPDVIEAIRRYDVWRWSGGAVRR